jgi:CDP-paratose 2-epimerase
LRILITGICGFAGNAIARGLLAHANDFQLVGIDNLSRKGSETNIESLRALGIDVRVGDIRNPPDIAALPSVEWVIDCAANPSVLAGIEGRASSRDLLDHNLIGTINLLEYCRERVAGFILLSTSRVYSIPPLAELAVDVHGNAFAPAGTFPAGFTDAGVSELFSTEPPLSLYGASKRCSELLALEYGEAFGFPVRLNRCGVLTGAGQFGKADQGIFSFWIHRWAARRPLKYLGFGGRGYQVRDCLHPRDLVPLLLGQMRDPGRIGPRVVNVAGGIENSMSLAGLSDWCTARFGSRSVESAAETRRFDVPWMVLDSRLAGETWQWNVATPLHAILEEIAQHAESNPEWLDLVA